MSASQRTKGAAAERELGKALSGLLSIEVTRNLTQTRDGGHDLNGLPFALEVKRQEKLLIKQWWAQTVRQSGVSGRTPALAYRQSRKPWRFVIPAYVLGYPGQSEALVDCVECGIELFAQCCTDLA